MKKHFKLGTLLKFIDFNKNENDAYFVVIQEESEHHDLVLQAINTTRYFPTGTTLVPESAEDFTPIELNAHDLINQEVTVKEHLFNDVVTSKAVYLVGENKKIQFHKKETYLLSNVQYDFDSNIKHKLIGNLYINLDTIKKL